MKPSQPVLIKGLDAKVFNESLSAYIPEETPAQVIHGGDKLHIDQFTLPSCGKMGEWIRSHLPWKPIIYMARFSGGYKGGFAHIDAFPSYNFYYVRRGRKHVYIVPRQYNPAVNFKPGYDSVYVGDDGPDDGKLEWDRPSPWRVRVRRGCRRRAPLQQQREHPQIHEHHAQPGDLHAPPPARGRVPETLRNDIFNWEEAKYFSHILWHGVTKRDTASIDSTPSHD